MAIESVHQALNQQLELTSTMLQVLEQEQSALANRAADQLVALAEQKQQLLESLQQIDGQIKQQLAGQPLPAELDELKQQVQTQLATCMQQNTVNGKAIEMSLGSLNRLQNALIKQRAGNSMTYNGKGKTTGRSQFGKSITA